MDEREDKEQRQEWLWGRHGDYRARGWECGATGRDSLQASTLEGPASKDALLRFLDPPKAGAHS